MSLGNTVANLYLLQNSSQWEMKPICQHAIHHQLCGASLEQGSGLTASCRPMSHSNCCTAGTSSLSQRCYVAAHSRRIINSQCSPDVLPGDLFPSQQVKASTSRQLSSSSADLRNPQLVHLEHVCRLIWFSSPLLSLLHSQSARTHPPTRTLAYSSKWRLIRPPVPSLMGQ